MPDPGRVVAPYLVTGCAGFIASNVCRLLLEAGHDVVGIDNLSAAYDPRLKEWRLAQLRTDPRFRFEKTDITDRRAVEAVFSGPKQDTAAARQSPPFAAVL